MRKGTKVRLLKDNSIGVISDSAFFKLNGKKHLRYEVKKKGGRGCLPYGALGGWSDGEIRGSQPGKASGFAQ